MLDKPNNEIAEITLLGTGGGYGESCVIHLGNDQWAVIDSCIDPHTKECLPLKYLRSLGVNIEKSVRLILCTHWHDDHIKGISRLFREATNSKLSFAISTDKKKFLRLVKLDAAKLKNEASTTSTFEFDECLKITESRGLPAIGAVQDKTLDRIKITGEIYSEIISLSPSDYTLEKYNDEISTLITEFGDRTRKIPTSSPNAKSVATFIKLGYHRAILGADLEVSNSNLEGWVNILENSKSIDKLSSLFKIAHHGSENGYHLGIWNSLLTSSPIAKLTPWNRNAGLPTPEMLQHYVSHTPYLYMTSAPINLNPKKRVKGLMKFIETLKCNLVEIPFQYGIIQSRINLLDPLSEWTTVFWRPAFQVSNSKSA